jgi:hypothetical protein
LANSDWRDVYRKERRRPGYVIENGKSLERLKARLRTALRRRALALLKKRAA